MSPEPLLHKVFLAFAGGGAKGVVHVGALRALEEQEFQILGVAGTSAGAIVAALVAAGYKADEIIDPNSGNSILDEFAAVDSRFRRPTALFGPWGWPLVWMFRAFHGVSLWALVTISIFAIILPMGVLEIAKRSWVFAEFLATSWTIASFFVFILLLLIVIGLARLDRLHRVLGVVMQRKMFPGEVGRIVRMADFDQPGRPTLKIVAANLNRRKLHLFSPNHSEWTPVADAICASVSLPVIFKLWRLGRTRFVDGGIVSNLPAWPFDEERELNPDAWTLAFDIRSRSTGVNVGAWNWLAAMVQTGFFGASELNLRAMRRTEIFDMESSLGLLDFDLKPSDVRLELRQATVAARELIGTRLSREPGILQNACDEIGMLVRTALDDLRIGQERANGRVRVAVALQDPSYRQSIRLRYHTGFAQDPDHHGLINFTVRLKEAWQSGEPELELAARGELQVERTGGVPGRPSWQDVRWRLAVPVWDTPRSGPGREFLILVDGSELLPEDPKTIAAMIELAGDVTTFFRNVLYGLDSDTET